MLVRGVIVQNQMNVQSGWSIRVNALEKLQPFLVTMTRGSLSQNLAIEIVQRRKEREGAVPVIIVRPGCEAPFSDRSDCSSDLSTVDAARWGRRISRGYLLIRGTSALFRATAIFWLASNFMLYRFASFYLQVSMCPCLGTLTPA
jgi:hypothetical protein